MEGGVGRVGWGYLPLYETVHAHERSELLGNEREAAVGEDSAVASHNFGKVRGLLVDGPGLVEEEVDGWKGGSYYLFPGNVGGHREMSLGVDHLEHKVVDIGRRCFQFGANLPGVD